jgi:SAM-dependent methyltransferase
MHRINDHNRFYLTEDRKQEPKEYFKFLVQQAAPILRSGSPRVLDIGCAAGDFLYYLRSTYPNARITGIDLEPEFTTKASQSLPGADFFVADVYSGSNLPAQKFDAVFMSGVSYLFPQFEPWVRHVVSLTEGSAYVFGVFNPEDLDVRAVVQRPGDDASTPWNVISQRSISLLLDRMRLAHRFIPWEMPFAIPRTHEDPLRSWTVEMSDGRYLVINGMQIVHRFAVLQIDVGVGF